MNNLTVRNIVRLDPSSLASMDALLHPEKYDWTVLHGDGPVDTTGMKGLRMCCTSCGGTLTDAYQNSPPICMDCGADDSLFYIYQIFERLTETVPDLKIYISPRGFLKIKTSITEGELHYTLDGSRPTLKNGHIFHKPFQMTGASCTIKATQFWANYRSQCVECYYNEPKTAKPAPLATPPHTPSRPPHTPSRPPHTPSRPPHTPSKPPPSPPAPVPNRGSGCCRIIIVIFLIYLIFILIGSLF